MPASILPFAQPFTVHKSIPRIIMIAGREHRAWAEDWRSPAECEAAMDAVLEFARSTENPAPDWDGLADLIMIALDVPKDSPFGCSVIVEPLT